MWGWIKKLFSNTTESEELPAGKPVEVNRSLINRPSSEQTFQDKPVIITSQKDLDAPSATTTVVNRKFLDQREAQEYIAKVKSKQSSLADRFSRGDINRSQFQELYEHYQTEIQNIEFNLAADPGGEQWKRGIREGQSMLLRHRLTAQAIGFSIYDNQSGMPIKSLGNFRVDPALFVPMLSAYQSATTEIFGGGIRSTEIETGRWLCFIPGKRTTTLALFTTEPASRQLKVLQDLQVIFENANANQLQTSIIDSDALVCPHEYYLKHLI